MASIKLSIQSESDNASVFLRLSIRRGFYIKRKTGIAINSKDWSSTSGLPKQNNPNNKNLTSKLRKLTTYILDRLNESNSIGDEIDGEWLSHSIDVFFNRAQEKGGKSEFLIDNIKRIIDTAPTRKNGKGGVGLSTSRIKGYGSLISTIESYQNQKKKRLKIKDINLDFSSDFSSFMYEKSYSVGYTQKKISDIKTVCLDAQKNGVETNLQLINVTGHKVKNNYILFLTEEELSCIKSTDYSRPALENSKKWLLLGAMIGQRGNDLLNISEKNITYQGNLKLLEFTQQKGNKQIIIPFSNQMESLLKEGFPYKISLQKFNIYMKDVCRIAGIDIIVEGFKKDKKTKRKVLGKYPKWEIISSHDLRRTFATNNYGKMPTPLIMSITGHSTEKTFLIYIGKTSIDYARQIADYYIQENEKSNKEFNPKIIKGKNAS